MGDTSSPTLGENRVPDIRMNGSDVRHVSILLGRTNQAAEVCVMAQRFHKNPSVLEEQTVRNSYTLSKNCLNGVRIVTFNPMKEKGLEFLSILTSNRDAH